MYRILKPKDSTTTSQLGSFCPFWTKLDGKIILADTAKEIIEALPPEKRVLDLVGVIERLQFDYLLGDRTLVQGVKRLPWRATLAGDGTVIRHPPIPHDNREEAPEAAAKRLLALLEEELLQAAGTHPRIFLLLSGGLDSRVSAGVLKRLEPQLHSEIICVTWGQPESRDVAYAERIAAWFDWEWVHIPYTPELVWENIRRGATWGGAEVNGYNLHGEYWFENANREDLVIASSFGDSVGRGEYSGTHIRDFKLAPLQNKHNLVYHSMAKRLLPQAEQDRQTAWEGVSRSPAWAIPEHDRQENYMRRMICHAMDYVRQYCSLHQAFTSEPVVEYMWSLSTDCRTGEIYAHLLKNFDNRLCSLPWARTGIAPDGSCESNPDLRQSYHQMDEWLRSENKDDIESVLFSPPIKKYGIFHASLLNRLRTSWLKDKRDWQVLGKPIVTIVTLTLFQQRFNISVNNENISWYDLFYPYVRRLF